MGVICLKRFSKLSMTKIYEYASAVALAGLTLAPLALKVNPYLSVILTAGLTVSVGSHRSIKQALPSERMSDKDAMLYPLKLSAFLLSFFLLFKFLPEDLLDAISFLFSVWGIITQMSKLLSLIMDYLPIHWNQQHFWRCLFIELVFTKSLIVASVLVTNALLWYALLKYWLANNILALAFCIQQIEKPILGSFKTGAILLVGLFAYDIFWVFFTPVMVSVATPLNAPTKLLFPFSCSSHEFLMLGLGDITHPGMFVALALRFDMSRGNKKRYFHSVSTGYILGLILAVVAKIWFQAAQPALLYVVPGVIGSLAAHGLWNGEVKLLFAYDESKVAADLSGSPNSQDRDTKPNGKNGVAVKGLSSEVATEFDE